MILIGRQGAAIYVAVSMTVLICERRHLTVLEKGS